ncbi:hypothetical protein RvY_04480 [Ramazzottius varieornatus]|uniref:Uncharacterized protein n=1 Tax=Ramazzottius varieornatus TaxID=947166 RepID=A0A1D1UVB6_RAMVA|nr:hypothetical protein RvY_04480 [Ramazzottius varieornatus]
MYYSDIAGASSHPASPIASGGTTVYSSVLSQYNRQSVPPGKSIEDLRKVPLYFGRFPFTYFRGVASDQHVRSFIPLSLPQGNKQCEFPSQESSRRTRKLMAIN